MKRVIIPYLFISYPLTKKNIKGLSYSFYSFLYWIKEKSVATLANHNICDQKQNTQVSSPTVSYLHTMNLKVIGSKKIRWRLLISATIAIKCKTPKSVLPPYYKTGDSARDNIKRKVTLDS